MVANSYSVFIVLDSDLLASSHLGSTCDHANTLSQDFCAKSVLSLIFPSIEAVRQVPQSTAEHQSTVTTGALCPPNDSTLSSAGSPLVSWNKREVKGKGLYQEKANKINIFILIKWRKKSSNGK